MRHSVLLCGLVAAVAGCAAPASDEGVSMTRSSIVGGTATTATPAVMALYGLVPGAEGGALCTATLINPRLLLTAAHCVATSTVGAGAEFSALIGADLNDAANRPLRLKVASVLWDEAFDSTAPQNGHDIGAAVLAEPITDIAPLAFNLEALPASLTGTDVRLVGYGLNDGFGQTGAGLKREAVVKLNSFDTTLVQTGSFFGRTICSGDSGGPVFATLGGVETVIAVNSFGIAFCIGPASSTRVDAYRTFVEKAIAASL